jgi:hypothetical protein
MYIYIYLPCVGVFDEEQEVVDHRPPPLDVDGDGFVRPLHERVAKLTGGVYQAHLKANETNSQSHKWCMIGCKNGLPDPRIHVARFFFFENVHILVHASKFT